MFVGNHSGLGECCPTADFSFFSWTFLMHSPHPKHFSKAVTKNFRGSPHIDQNDLSVQYALSVGDFGHGGELCVEECWLWDLLGVVSKSLHPETVENHLSSQENPLLVKVLNSHNRLVCIDGRFPHWVSGYSGERCTAAARDR